MTTMDWREHIESRPDVMMGKPVIRGTRITVEIILDWLAAGWTEAEIFENYPRLTPESLRAVYALSREVVHDQLFIVPKAA
jgi:uncharacterized protein (DUF433 family)